MAKPLRAKHCKTCNHCVARFDHHCHWMDNCIGVNNHKWFVLLITLVYLGHIFWVKIVIYCMYYVYCIFNLFIILILYYRYL